MSEISRSLKIEGPRAGERIEDAGVMVEYMGLRVIFFARKATPRDRTVCLMVQTDDGEEDIMQFPVRPDGATTMPVSVASAGVVE